MIIFLFKYFALSITNYRNTQGHVTNEKAETQESNRVIEKRKTSLYYSKESIFFLTVESQGQMFGILTQLVQINDI